MRSSHARVSLADLAGAGIRLRPSEAVAIVRDIALQVIRGDLPGVPSAHVIRFAPSGQIVVEGPVATDGPDVSRAAHLLDTLLGGFGDAEPAVRVSGALRIVIARAIGTLDLPPHASLPAFAEALSRFAAADVSALVRELHATWSASVQAGTIVDSEWISDGRADGADAPAPPRDGQRADDALTISDIRRARRETRLTLAEVSERSRIPAWLLRELEWGYFRNWPAGLYGRTQLVRYARAAGLDDRLVVRTIWPALEVEARRRGTASVAPEDLDPADPEQVNAAAMLVPVERGAVMAMPPNARDRHRYRLVAATTITVLLGIALLPGGWARWSDEAPAHPPADPPRAARQAPAEDLTPHHTVEPPGFASVGTAVFPDEPDAGIIPASHGGGMALRITRVGDDGSRNYHAQVSPAGERIAFDSDRDGARGVYVADVDGRNVRRVSGLGFAAWPSWSPDGRSLLFVRAEPQQPDVWNLWSVDLERSRRVRLTSHDTGQPWGGSWFPDGHRLVYARDAALVVLDTRTGEERGFPSPVLGRSMRGPSVSPDGEHVVVQVLRDGAWLLSVSDGSMRRVLTDPTAEAFSWAQDGRRVAYHSRRTGGWNVWVKAGAF